HRDRHIAKLGERLNARVLPHHDRPGAHGGVEPDDFAVAQLLHALDRAPFAHRIDFERAALQLAFLPTRGEILHPAFGALGIVLVIDHIEALLHEEALLDCNSPGTIVSVAVALQADGAGHGSAVSKVTVASRSYALKFKPSQRNGRAHLPGNATPGSN